MGVRPERGSGARDRNQGSEGQQESKEAERGAVCFS